MYRAEKTILGQKVNVKFFSLTEFLRNDQKYISISNHIRDIFFFKFQKFRCIFPDFLREKNYQNFKKITPKLFQSKSHDT